MKEVHVYFIDASLYDVGFLKLLPYIDEIDVLKCMKYKQEIDQKERLVSCYLKNRFIGKDIYLNESGKPLAKDKYFNISHSHGVVCLATSDNDLGVDIELIKETKEDIKKFISNEEEYDYIKSDENFYEIWTSKEAISKADGRGIKGKISLIPSLPLKGIKSYLNNEYSTETFRYKNYVVSIAVRSDDKLNISLEEIKLAL